MLDDSTKSSNITIGADPEFFLYRDNKPVSAHDIVPGTKKKPFPLKNGVHIQADGTAVEFNISPAKTKKEFCDSITDALDQIRGVIPKEYTFKYVGSVRYGDAYFNTLPKIATEIGCTPEFSGVGKGRIVIKNPPKSTLRAAGGHIHVGWGEKLDVNSEGHIFDCCVFSNAFDAIQGIYSTIWDTDKERQNLYGVGAPFRPKEYGVEYRGLSTAWLQYPKLYPWIWDITIFLFDALKRGTKIKAAGDYLYKYPNKYNYETGRYIEDPRNPYDSYGRMKKNYLDLLENIYKLDNLDVPKFPRDWSTEQAIS